MIYQKDRILTLYIHGLFGSSQDFSFFLDDQSIAIDLEDFDHENLSLETISASIYLKLKSVGLEAVNIVGYSLGGRIGFYLKLIDPIFFRRCIFIGSKLSMNPSEITSKIISHIFWEISYATLDTKTFFRLWYKQPIFQSFEFKAHLEKRIKINKEFFQKCFNKLSILNQLDMENKLKPYQKDLLFIYGENDLTYKNYYENIKKIGYQIQGIRQASHPVFLENPIETKNVINWFFYDANEGKTNSQMDRS